MFKIPNLLLILFFLALLFQDHTLPANFFLERFMAALICFLLFYSIYWFSRGLGFGDVKYAALLGYALGLEKTSIAFLFTAFSAILVYAIGIGCFRWDKSAKLPFAPFLGFGAVAAEVFKISVR
jgi:prepilin signal peptidase PulO-like enzyme (type II secretory pathway)